MIDPAFDERQIGPVHSDLDEPTGEVWARRLVLFLRLMAGVALVEGLYYWAIVCGVGAPTPQGFESYTVPYQSATVFFAVIDLVAAVGLWLAAPWGAVVWLTSVISMIAVEALFPQIYGGEFWVILVALCLLGAYLALAILAAREQPP
ncbi:MAG TPA: DUF6163 family protein [Xanthobacteraceae bacterium]|nr:DUF6163 family protein [Xanthobacteraceae bacterium]